MIPPAAQPLRGVRRAMASNMARSHAAVVPATVTDEADIGGWRGGEDATMRLVRAIVAGCGAVPALNANFLGETDGRVLHEHIDLGIATDPDGLFVPVLRNVGRRDAADLRRGLERMKADVRARSVPREELVGATITLSNFGMFGGRHAQMVILPPQVAIVGAGRIALICGCATAPLNHPRAASLPDFRSSRGHGRGSGALPRRAGRRPRAARLTGVPGAIMSRVRSNSPTISDRPRSCICMSRPRA